MVRVGSILWEYFDKIRGTKSARCKACAEIFSFATTTANLKCHLRRKHHSYYNEVVKSQEQAKLLKDSDEGNSRVIYEYVVASSPTSSVEDSETKNDGETPIIIQPKESRSSFSEKRRKLSHHADGYNEGKKLIEKLTEEKICVANLQKELIEKEMEEKNLKIFLLQEEVKHKQVVCEVEKQEIEYRKEKIEHQKQMDELEKQEMLLKIEILKTNLGNIKNGSSSL